MKRLSALTVLVSIMIGLTFADTAQAAPIKEWTVAVFLNADNDLGKFGIRDQQQMSWAGSNDCLNIVTLIDRLTQPAVVNHIEKNRITPISEPAEIDMGSPEELVKFIRLIKEKFPARHYCLCIWNHGKGWRDYEKRSIPPLVKGISYDFSSDNSISTNQLGPAMREISEVLGQKLDMLVFDACLMQMVEVAYACREHVDFIVASEETEPATGAPYHDILNALVPGTSPEEFSRIWVKTYIKSYLDDLEPGYYTTQSAIRCSEVDSLLNAMNDLAGIISSGDQRSLVEQARRNVQTFAYPDHIDLQHFCERLITAAGENEDSPVVKSCRNLTAVLGKLVIETGTAGKAVADAKGIAVYFPGDFVLNAHYRELEFASDSLWDEMISALHGRRIADGIRSDLLSGDLSTLQRFMADRNRHDPEFHRSVMQTLNFSLAHEIQDTCQSGNRVQIFLNSNEIKYLK